MGQLELFKNSFDNSGSIELKFLLSEFDVVNSVRACMYLTYKLNNEKGSLAKYASVLKETFSCFNKNTESSIQTNLSKSVVPFVKLLKKINMDRASIGLDVISKNNLAKTDSFG